MSRDAMTKAGRIGYLVLWLESIAKDAEEGDAKNFEEIAEFIRAVHKVIDYYAVARNGF